MSEQTYNIHYQADVIEELLDKIHDLGNASGEEAGLMTAADKTKLDGIASGAQVNVLEGVKLGDTALVPTEKVVTIPVDSTPTASSNNPISSGGVKTALDNLNAGVMTFAGNLVDTRSAGTRQSFAFRQSGGDGVNYMRKILGRTEAFNQIVPNGNFADTSGWVTTNSTLAAADNILTATLTASASQIELIRYAANFTTVFASHRYLMLVDIMPSVALTRVVMYNVAGQNDFPANTWTKFARVFSPSVDATIFDLYAVGTLTDGDTIKFRNCIIIDLTLEGLGLTTADQFRALHPLPYYNDNAGVLKNNAATGLETVGFNQWDEEWNIGWINQSGQDSNEYQRVRCKNYIPVVAGAQYYVRIPAGAIVVRTYDANKNYVGTFSAANEIFTIPSGVNYIRFYAGESYGSLTQYNHDICINLSDASRNGTYEPYWKRDIVLGLGNLACHDEDDNAVVVNGLDGVGTSQDELIVENGWGKKINKKMEEVDMGDLDWSYSATYLSFYVQVSKLPAGFNKALLNTKAINSKFATLASSGIDPLTIPDKTMQPYNAYLDQYLVIKESAYTDAATFKAAMSGVKLRYELATPKVLTLDNPIPALIEVDNLGTEKRLPEDTAAAPQAPFECDSNYSVSTANLLRKLNS